MIGLNQRAEGCLEAFHRLVEAHDKNRHQALGQDLRSPRIEPDRLRQFSRSEVVSEPGEFAALLSGTCAGAGVSSGAVALISSFGAASTGTAIASLSGAAHTSATFAWLGGGSLATGGAGVAGGMATLGGLALIPALVVSGFFSHRSASQVALDTKQAIDAIRERLNDAERSVQALERTAAAARVLAVSIEEMGIQLRSLSERLCKLMETPPSSSFWSRLIGPWHSFRRSILNARIKRSRRTLRSLLEESARFSL